LPAPCRLTAARYHRRQSCPRPPATRRVPVHDRACIPTPPWRHEQVTASDQYSQPAVAATDARSQAGTPGGRARPVSLRAWWQRRTSAGHGRAARQLPHPEAASSQAMEMAGRWEVASRLLDSACVCDLRARSSSGTRRRPWVSHVAPTDPNESRARAGRAAACRAWPGRLVVVSPRSQPSIRCKRRLRQLVV
jgi:hypothetical protein